MRNPKETINNIIDNQGVAFISSVESKGCPNTKDMLPPRKRKKIGEFYFTSNTPSMRAAQYRENTMPVFTFVTKVSSVE